MSILPQTESEKQFVSLLTQYQADICGYIMSLMAGNNEAHDVLQETNVILWDKREHFELGTNFKAWAFAIARFTTMNYQKKRRRLATRLEFSDSLIEKISYEAPVALTDGNERLHHLARR